jgi:predicted HTH transcriptional regulator
MGRWLISQAMASLTVTDGTTVITPMNLNVLRAIVGLTMAEEIKIEHLGAVSDYVRENGAITNRECRQVTGLSYDSSIKIFGALCLLGMLKKAGESSATKYVSNSRQETTAPKRPGYHRKIKL